MKNKIIIGKIYADWCGHCQSLKPEWKKMKKMIKSKSNIQIIEIGEHQTNKIENLKNKFPHIQVNGYPTIFKIQPNKEIEYYTGNRLAFDMKKWAAEKKSTSTKKFRQSLNKNTNTKKNTRFFGFLQ
jgi:hypothetical protein